MDPVLELRVHLAEPDHAEFDSVCSGDGGPEIIDEIEDIRIDVVGVTGVEQDVLAARDVAEDLFEGGFAEVTDLISEFDAEHFTGRVTFDDSSDGAARVAVEDESDAGGGSDEDPDEQIGEEDSDDGGDEGDELAFSFAPHLAEQGGAGEFESGDEEDGTEGGEGDPVEQVGDEEDAEGEEDAMEDGTELCFPAGIDVDAASDNHRGHWESSEEAGDDITDTLCDQFAIGRRHSLFGVQFVDGFEVEQGFERGHDGNRDAADVNVGLEECGEVGKGEE
jgi:hypothetical protein